MCAALYEIQFLAYFLDLFLTFQSILPCLATCQCLLIAILLAVFLLLVLGVLQLIDDTHSHGVTLYASG
jgi:hypothetical protein